MVAENVQAYTEAGKKNSQGQWESDGSGSYTIEKADDQKRGTKIVIKLKDDFKDFAKKIV